MYGESPKGHAGEQREAPLMRDVIDERVAAAAFRKTEKMM